MYSQLTLRRSMSLFCSLYIPFYCVFIILRDAFSCFIKLAEMILRIGVTLISRFYKPFCCVEIVSLKIIRFARMKHRVGRFCHLF